MSKYFTELMSTFFLVLTNFTAGATAGLAFLVLNPSGKTPRSKPKNRLSPHRAPYVAEALNWMDR